MRIEAFRNRYRGYKKPSWIQFKERLDDELNDRRATRIARDPYAIDGLRTRKIETTLLLLDLIESDSKSKSHSRIINDFYVSTMTSSDEAVFELQMYHYLFTMLAETFEKIYKEHSEITEAINGLERAVRIANGGQVSRNDHTAPVMEGRASARPLDMDVQEPVPP